MPPPRPPPAPNYRYFKYSSRLEPPHERSPYDLSTSRIETNQSVVNTIEELHPRFKIPEPAPAPNILVGNKLGNLRSLNVSAPAFKPDPSSHITATFDEFRWSELQGEFRHPSLSKVIPPPQGGPSFVVGTLFPSLRYITSF